MPQKYAPDGQLGSWVANIRSKRKLMSKRGEEFEPDIESSPIPDPAEYDDIVVGDENNVVFEDGCLQKFSSQRNSNYRNGYRS